MYPLLAPISRWPCCLQSWIKLDTALMWWASGTKDFLTKSTFRRFDTSSGFLTAAERIILCSWFLEEHGPWYHKWTYNSYIYPSDLTDILKRHDPNDPLFLYLPLHNVHSTRGAPEEWVNIYESNSTCKEHNKLQAMVSVVDNVTGHIVELLKAKKDCNTILCLLKTVVLRVMEVIIHWKGVRVHSLKVVFEQWPLPVEAFYQRKCHGGLHRGTPHSASWLVLIHLTQGKESFHAVDSMDV